MAHDEDQTCLCCYEHRPGVMEFIEHHIVPSFMGGPDTPENRIWICPNTHYNTHEILRLLVARVGLLTYEQAKALNARPVPRYAFNLALEGYQEWKANL